MRECERALEQAKARVSQLKEAQVGSETGLWRAKRRTFSILSILSGHNGNRNLIFSSFPNHFPLIVLLKLLEPCLGCLCCKKMMRRCLAAV